MKWLEMTLFLLFSLESWVGPSIRVCMGHFSLVLAAYNSLHQCDLTAVHLTASHAILLSSLLQCGITRELMSCKASWHKSDALIFFCYIGANERAIPWLDNSQAYSKEHFRSIWQDQPSWMAGSISSAQECLPGLAFISPLLSLFPVTGKKKKKKKFKPTWFKVFIFRPFGASRMENPG